jgi:hypothetical protein
MGDHLWLSTPVWLAAGVAATLALTLSPLRRLRSRQDGRIGVYTLSGTQAERR